jgi:hypothetical protein
MRLRLRLSSPADEERKRSDARSKFVCNDWGSPPTYLAQEQTGRRPTVGARSALPVGRGTPQATIGDHTADHTGFNRAQGDTRRPALRNLVFERGGGHGRVVPCVQRVRVRALPGGLVGRGGEHALVDPFI